MVKAIIAGLCLLLLLPTVALADMDAAVTRRVVFLDSALSFDAEQKAAFAALLKDLAARETERRRARRGAGDGGNPGEDRARGGGTGDPGVAELPKAVEGLLSEDQLGPYRDLVDRERSWWLDPRLLEMDGLLTLDHEQCLQIHPILRRTRIRLRALQEEARESRDRSALEDLREAMTEANEDLLEFLDDEQQVRWRNHIEEQEQEMAQMRASRGARAGGRGGKGGRQGF